MAVKIIIAVVVAAAVWYGLHRLARYAEWRGWIYYQAEDRPRSAGFSFLAPIYAPETEHVIEETASLRVRADQNESGESRPEDDDD
jgi:hypothetical protein